MPSVKHIAASSIITAMLPLRYRILDMSSSRSFRLSFTDAKREDVTMLCIMSTSLELCEIASHLEHTCWEPFLVCYQLSQSSLEAETGFPERVAGTSFHHSLRT